MGWPDVESFNSFLKIASNFMTDKMLCDYVMIDEPCFHRFILGRSPEKSNSVCEVRLRLTVADV